MAYTAKMQQIRENMISNAHLKHIIINKWKNHVLEVQDERMIDIRQASSG